MGRFLIFVLLFIVLESNSQKDSVNVPKVNKVILQKAQMRDTSKNSYQKAQENIRTIDSGDESTPWYMILAQVVAIPAFLFSLWPILSPLFLKLKIIGINENQIQLAQVFGNGKYSLGINIFYTIIARGPETKWETFKFVELILTSSNGLSQVFSCTDYLMDKKNGQDSISRNTPVAIKGKDSKTITAAFNSVGAFKIESGEYIVLVSIINSKGQGIKCKPIIFEINKQNIVDLQNPKMTLMIPTKS